MRFKYIALIILLVSCSLIGLVLIQFNWIKETFEIRQQHFDHSAQEALDDAIELYEKYSTYKYILLNSEGSEKGKDIIDYKMFIQNKGKIQSIDFFESGAQDSSNTNNSKLSDYIDINENLLNKFTPNQLNDFKQQIEKQKSYFQNLAEEMLFQNKCIDEKLEIDTLKLFIHEEFERRGIKTKFNTAVLDANTLGIIYSDFKFLDQKIFDQAFKIYLFPNDYYSNSGIVTVYFPEKKSFIIQSMGLQLGLSGLLILVIMGCFSLTVYIIVQQKKLSDMKTDFINNMTHELKTPVATISLASDMLKNKKIQEQPEKLAKYANIIKDENERLSVHIERVLQAAKLDKTKINLNLTQVHVHLLITDIINKLQLRIDQENGSILSLFEAHNDLIEADKVHLTNIILNLFDNAIKYRKEDIHPKITVCTSNFAEGIQIDISDNGIGMTKETLNKIFDKFYRVPTGNVHNVKGFGLGLNYVKEMVEAHGGFVTVKSNPGEGSQFTIKLFHKCRVVQSSSENTNSENN